MFGGASSTSEVAAEYNRDDDGDDDEDEGADIASWGIGGADETKAEARVADSATRRIVRFFAIVRNL